MRRLAVAFSGRSGSGKTTLILKIAQKLIDMGFKVCVTKHDPGDKAVFDTAKKDSYKFSSLGVDVAVVSPKKVCILLKTGLFGQIDRIDSQAHKDKNENFAQIADVESLQRDLKQLISYFRDFDYLFIEGLKQIPLPRISVFRDEFDPSFVPFSDAIVSNLQLNFKKPTFGLDDVEGIISWINNNARKV